MIDFLPTSQKEMNKLGWTQPDIILVTADAYVDHPSFGAPLIGRYLQSLGYRVAILSQPDWRDVNAFQIFGPPKLFWGITSGAVDSRLNLYSSMGNRRKTNVYSPAGRTDLTPDRPLLAYTSRARQAYKGIPIILGGLEASLRRLTHYDYIEDKIKRSILIDAKADLLVHGMGELPIKEIAQRLKDGQPIESITDIPGTAYPLNKGRTAPDDVLTLPSLQEIQDDNTLFMTAHKAYQQQAHPNGKPVRQMQDPTDMVINPPARPLTTEEMDSLYDLPFTRSAHPSYKKIGPIPALQSIQFSITSHRGCFGGCSFCSLYFHQGKHISTRTEQSIIKEAESFLAHPEFKNTISDIGGPTANMYAMSCTSCKTCTRPSCIYPNVCKNLQNDHQPVIKMLQNVLRWAAKQPKPINIFIASGVRHDLALHSKDYINLLTKHFVGGHLKIAPEHYCPHILQKMGKPSFSLFEEFEEQFNDSSKRAGKEQYLVPYFISAHPGSSTDEALELCKYFVNRNWKLRQVQDFTPIPLTLSTAMYVSERDPQNHPIHIAKGRSEKRLQMALLKYHEPQNFRIIAEFLNSIKTKRNQNEINALLAKIKHAQIMSPQNDKAKKGKKKFSPTQGNKRPGNRSSTKPSNRKGKRNNRPRR